MRLAKGIQQTLSVGFKNEYLQLYQYNMQGVLIKVTNVPPINPVKFTFKINGVIVIADTTLIIPATQSQIDIPYSLVLYKGDVLTFECTEVIDGGVGNSVFFGIY